MSILEKSNRTLSLPFECNGERFDEAEWVQWAVSLGFDFHRQRELLESELVIVTTPCQSPIAGIIGIGWLIAELENQIRRDDAASYFEHLLSLPVGTRVKRIDQLGTKPKEYSLRNKRNDSEIEMKQVGGRGARKSGSTKHFLVRKHSLNYIVAGEEDREASGNDALCNSQSIRYYQQMSPRIPSNQNWKANIDSIVFAGPTAGNSSPRKNLRALRFLLDNQNEGKSVADLLAVREWKESGDQTPHYSRFFNAAKSRNDIPEIIAKSQLVFFTSVESFLRFGDSFAKQIKILVLSRDIGDSKVELLESKLSLHLRNATKLDSEVINKFEQPPIGIQLLFFGRRILQEPEW